jgi:uncharacterized surface protein with fasciclin (FAS1) repeats
LTEISAQGVTVDLPSGFEGRATQRSTGAPGAGASSRPPATPFGAASTPGQTLAIVHAATIPLPPEVGDFGSNVVDVLGRDDVFVVVFEYDATAANTALFAEQGIPRSLELEAFSPTLLQRSLPGQAGAQRFFTENGRAFCVYAVLGSAKSRSALVAKVNDLLATLQIEETAPAAGTPPTSTTTTVPLGNVVDVVSAQADLATFADLLGVSGLGTVIAGTGPFTVFAPTDAAFAAVDLGALRADPSHLRYVLEYHVAPGDLLVNDLTVGRRLDTLAGPSLTVGRSGSAPTVDDATLVRPDLDASNGEVHVIDRVLDPPR